MSAVIQIIIYNIYITVRLLVHDKCFDLDTNIITSMLYSVLIPPLIQRFEASTLWVQAAQSCCY